MSENHQFFAVAYGNQRGIFDNYKVYLELFNIHFVN